VPALSVCVAIGILQVFLFTFVGAIPVARLSLTLFMVISSRSLTTLLLCCMLACVAALDEKRKFVALASIPFPGHAKPLHRIGQELALRGHDVKIFMMKRAGYTKEFEKDTLVEFIPLGDYEKDVCDEVITTLQ
jgi:hypothetical protein